MAVRGGHRVGSGRPKGARTASDKSKFLYVQQRAQEMLAKGDKHAPLEVMLSYMWVLEANGDLETAAAVAVKAAPYVHPKLQAVDHTSDSEPMTIQIVQFGDSGRADTTITLQHPHRALTVQSDEEEC
jgi:hypothetical protein